MGFFFLAETRLLFKCGKGDGYCTCETFERGWTLTLEGIEAFEPLNLTVGTNMLLTSGNMAEKIVLVAPCKSISVALVYLCAWFFTISSSLLVCWLMLTEEENLSQKYCFLQNDAHAEASLSTVPDKPCWIWDMWCLFFNLSEVLRGKQLYLLKQAGIL